MIRVMVLAGLLLAGLLLAGCRAGASPTPGEPPAPTANQDPSENPLDGRRWELLSMKGQPPLPETTITLNFQGNTLGGLAGCNRYGGRYSVEGNRLRLVDHLTLTAMLCNAPAGVMEQEQEYWDTFSQLALTNTATFRVVPGNGGDRLEIGDPLGVPVLIFQGQPVFDMNPNALPGTAWRLVSLEGTPQHAAGITLSFINQREMIAFVGCRYVYGIYQARADRLSFSFMAMIGADCHEDEQRNLQESTFTDALSRSSSYHIAGDRLDLLTEQGGVTSFLAAEPDTTRLEDAVWTLAATFDPSLDPQMFHRLPIEPLPGSTITLEFDGQRASGSAGCNEYFAPYTASQDRLTIEAAVTTDMHCAQPEGIMRQEAEFLRLLPMMNAYHMLSGPLWLESADGYSMLFIRRETGQ